MNKIIGAASEFGSRRVRLNAELGVIFNTIKSFIFYIILQDPMFYLLFMVMFRFTGYMLIKLQTKIAIQPMAIANDISYTNGNSRSSIIIKR